MIQSRRGIRQKTALKTWREAWDEDPSMFENCSKLFIDLGSNAGTHIRKLFEPDKYPQSKYSQVFDDAFGSSSFRQNSSAITGICAFGFEANPRFVSRYHDIEAAYHRQGWRARWFAPAAVSNESGNVTFWLNDDLPINEKDDHMDWSASTVNRGSNSSSNITVPEMEFASFLEAVRLHAAPGYRLMKMDIEGAEFPVLAELLERGLLCEGSLDLMTIEWHLRLVPESNREPAEEVMRQVKSAGKCAPKKDTQVLEFDDESYLKDGQPLP